MANRILTLIVGGLVLTVGAIALLASLVPGVELPPAAYVPIALGLFGGVYLIGVSHGNQLL